MNWGSCGPRLSVPKAGTLRMGQGIPETTLIEVVMNETNKEQTRIVNLIKQYIAEETKKQVDRHCYTRGFHATALHTLKEVLKRIGQDQNDIH